MTTTNVPNDKLIFLANDNARVVKVTYDEFGSGVAIDESQRQQYAYKTLDQTIKVDDLVLVQAGTRHGYVVCKVTAVDEPVDYNDHSIKLKWIVSKVEVEAFKTLLSQEREMILTVQKAQQKKQREELKASLEEATGASLAIGCDVVDAEPPAAPDAYDNAVDEGYERPIAEPS